MRVELLDDRVLVKQAEAKKVSPGGIALPDSAQGEENEGTVLAVGPGKMLNTGSRAEMMVKLGDTVLFQKFAGMHIEMDEEDYLVLREAEIIGIAREGA